MSAFDNALEGWGPDLPDWIRELALECDRTSQNKTAARLGYTAGAISQVIRNRYAAGTSAIEEQVRGMLMSETVPCPVLGDIGKDACRKWRGRARRDVLINTLHTTMRRGCMACPRHRSNDLSHTEE